ncbi:Oidioi.mRNA.OKI2018_I69.chr1.g1629.t1.cds [Oikopleura dioica]|uniref:Oidioi.mRNA.OKI2018_I69.chr1.g1629.t1.cds n=1 Tax=Oikopleura dioica TaxID=34765 RepID=A0ABN7SUT5_OIKDI|nr:Oidioi.mRNA.OKI2018_I69.chr1.g1629.t1.cds [Oikopleura dioica]
MRQINVILPVPLASYRPYALLENGESKSLSLKSPADYKLYDMAANIYKNKISSYTLHSRQALVNDQLHIFGGYDDENRIARLDGCMMTELPVRLIYSYSYSHAALSVKTGDKAIICFDEVNDQNCEWSKIGSLSKAVEYPSAINLGNSVFVFPGYTADEKSSAAMIFAFLGYESSVQKISLGKGSSC